MITKDPLVALKTLLLANDDVKALVDTRVYIAELDAEDSKDMPQAAIVLQNSPGATAPKGCMKVGAVTFDLWAYGANTEQASTVDRAAYGLLKFLLRKDVDNTLIHSVTPISDPVYLRDEDTKSPVYIRSYSVLAAEIATA